MKALLLFILPLFIGCSSDNKVPLKNIRLPDNFSAAAHLNHIDTIFLISNNLKIKRFCSDTVGFLVYDSIGNFIQQDWKEIMGTSVYFKYDHNNLPIFKQHSTDADYKLHLSYNFNPFSGRLLQIWNISLNSNSFIDTCWYDYNSKGQIIASKAPTIKSIFPSRKFYTTFLYNEVEQLILKTSIDTSENLPLLTFETYGQVAYKMTTAYYYTNGELDSSITEYFDKGKSTSQFKSTTYYFQSLPIQTILCDTIKTVYAWKKGST